LSRVFTRFSRTLCRSQFNGQLPLRNGQRSPLDRSSMVNVHHSAAAQWSTSTTRWPINGQLPPLDRRAMVNFHHSMATQWSTFTTRPQLNGQLPPLDGHSMVNFHHSAAAQWSTSTSEWLTFTTQQPLNGQLSSTDRMNGQLPPLDGHSMVNFHHSMATQWSHFIRAAAINGRLRPTCGRPVPRTHTYIESIETLYHTTVRLLNQCSLNAYCTL